MHVPDHVFLSYSSDDQQAAQEIASFLEAAGIAVWVDSSFLIPGTPDWEIAIRDAVARSYALILVASPSASQSRYVRAEIALAEGLGVVVYPVWWRGERWIDSIPLGLAYTQHIDLREDIKAAGLQRLKEILSRTIARLSPSHYLVSPLRHFRKEGSTTCITATRPPRGYLSIELPPAPPRKPVETAGRAAFFLLSELRTVSDLLDSLYINYLSSDFPPLTYGQLWVLRENHWKCGRVLADWSFLSADATASSHRWAIANSRPADAGIDDRGEWIVSAIGDFTPIGLAVHDPRILQALRISRKALWGLRRRVLADVPIPDVDPALSHRFVVWFDLTFGEELRSDRALAQIGDASQEVEWWCTR